MSAARARLGAAAAVLVVVGVMGATALDDNEQGVIDQPTSSSTTATVVAGDVDRPDEVVAVDATGRVIVVDVATGETVRELAAIVDPPGAGSPFSIIGVAVAADRRWVYCEVSPEPASGSIFKVPYRGGDAVQIAGGSFAEPSPDGSMLATSYPGQGLSVWAVDEPHVPVVATSTETVDRVGWSVDGKSVYADRFVGDVTTETLVFELSGPSLTLRRVLRPPEGQGWASPTGRADGNVLVDAHPTDGSRTSSVATVLNPDTGEVVTSFDLGQRARSLTYDSTGTWLVVSFDDSVRWFGDDGESGAIPGAAGWLDADW